MPPEATVEIRLRIPQVKEPVTDRTTGFPVNNSEVRFIKRIELASIPKAGDIIQLTAQPDHVFAAAVARADWSEEKEIFIVACRYTNRSIQRAEYLALVEDQQWTMKGLLED